MERQYIGEFFVLFFLFGAAMNCFSYLFSHIFSNPDTGMKYLSVIYMFGLFIGPLVVTSIIAAVIGEEQSFQDGFSFWFYFTPLVTFSLTT